mgnify:CR=1 FL=1
MVESNKEELQLELNDLFNLFEVSDIIVKHTEIDEKNKITNEFRYIKDGQEKSYSFTYDMDNSLSDLRKKSLRKRMVKNQLYKILSENLNKTLPWGSLTGVRPTKLARDLIDYGEMKDYLVAEILERDYYVSHKKAELVASILRNQKCIIRNDNLVDLYINIPICPTRCVYCSFISSELSRVKDKVDIYIDTVIKEINAVKNIIKRKAYVVRSIYIGGGTPSVLTARQLDSLLNEVNFLPSEFTVECGRADTITDEKLDILKNHGVTRISINPQTFCEATLKRIGRKQKNKDILSAYQKALARDFVVNMDFIAGLPGEKLGIFKRTINTALELYPNNITVHTLSLKKGSTLFDNNGSVQDRDVEKMIDYAEDTLAKNGYKPYYLYRQKHQLSGLENVGYFRDGDVCIFNIDSMEETNTIIGVGANAISKRVYNIEHTIKRQPNVKFIEDYVDRIDEIIEKKEEFFK